MRELLCITLLFSVAFATPKGFIHPLDFDESKEQQKQVLQYITERQKVGCCGAETCQTAMLEIMYDQNLKASKKKLGW